MADVSSYDSSLPSGSSEIRKGDDRLRTHWWDLESALTEEHYFTDSTGSGGIHKPGSSRISYGNGPAPTADDEGRLFYDVDGDTLVVQGSSATTGVTGAFSGARANRQTSQDINASGALSLSDISWDEEFYDTDDYFSATTTHLIAPSDGKYAVSATLSLNAQGGAATIDGRYDARLRVRNGKQIARSGMSVQDLDQVNLSGVAEMSAGSVLNAQWAHTDENVSLAGDISIHKLGN